MLATSKLKSGNPGTDLVDTPSVGNKGQMVAWRRRGVAESETSRSAVGLPIWVGLATASTLFGGRNDISASGNAGLNGDGSRSMDGCWAHRLNLYHLRNLAAYPEVGAVRDVEFAVHSKSRQATAACDGYTLRSLRHSGQTGQEVDGRSECGRPCP